MTLEFPHREEPITQESLTQPGLRPREATDSPQQLVNDMFAEAHNAAEAWYTHAEQKPDQRLVREYLKSIESWWEAAKDINMKPRDFIIAIASDFFQTPHESSPYEDANPDVQQFLDRYRTNPPTPTDDRTMMVDREAWRAAFYEFIKKHQNETSHQ